MSELINLNYTINDTTMQNLTLKDLGIAKHYVPNNFGCANIKVFWAEPTGMETVVLGVFTYFTTILAHEWGHILALKYYLRFDNVLAKFGIVDNKPRVWTGIEAQYQQLEPKEKVIVYLAGIVAGLVPLMIASLINGYLLLLLIPYLFRGCKTDIYLIRVNLSTEEKVKQQDERLKEWFKNILRPRQKNGSKRN